MLRNLLRTTRQLTSFRQFVKTLGSKQDLLQNTNTLKAPRRVSEVNNPSYENLVGLTNRKYATRCFSTDPEGVLTNIHNLDARNVYNLLSWYTETQFKEVNKDFEVLTKIISSVEKHITNGNFSMKELLDIGIRFREMGYFSRSLANRLFDNISSEKSLNLEEGIKLLEGLSRFKVSNSASLNIALLNKLSEIPEEQYDTFSASLVLKYLAQLSIQSQYRESIHYSVKLLRMLEYKINDLTMQEMNNILDFYSNTPIFSRDLLYKTYEKACILLETSSISTDELLHLVKTIGRMVYTGTICPSDFREKLRKYICKQDQGINSKDYSELILGLNQFTAYLPENLSESLLNRFVTQPYDGNSFAILRGLAKMNMKSLDIVPDIKEKLLESILSGSVHNMILAYHHLSNSKKNKVLDELIHPIHDKLIKNLTSLNMLEYIQSIRRIIADYGNLNTGAFEEIHNKLLRLLNEDTTLSDANVFNLTIPFTRSDHSLPIKIFSSRCRTLDSSVISTILRTNENTISSYEIAKILKSIKTPSEDLILFSFSFLDQGIPQHLASEIISYSNLLPGSIIKSFDFQTISDNFFNKVKDVGSKNMETFKENIVGYLDSLPSDHYEKHYFLQSLSSIAKLHKQCIPPELADRVLNAYLKNENLYKNPCLMDLLSLYRGFDGNEIVREKVLPKYFDITNGISINRLQKLLKSYRYWPHYEKEAEDEFKRRVVRRIEKVSMNDIQNLIEFLKNFETLKYQSHQDLMSSTLRALTEKIIAYQSSITMESMISVMKSVSKHDTRLSNYYEKTMKYIMDNFDKLNETQKVKIAHALAYRGLNDIQYFTMLSQNVVNNTKRYYNLAHLVLSSFGELNLENTEIAQNVLNAFLDAFHNRRHHFDSELSWNHYIWSLVKLQAPSEEIRRAISISNKFETHNFPDFKKVLLLNHFSLYPIGETYRNPDDVHYFVNSLSFKRHFNYDSIANMKLKNLMVKYNIKFERGYSKDGVYSPFYLPQLDRSVWLIHDNDLLYSGESLKGDYLMHQQHISKKYSSAIFLKASEFAKTDERKIVDILVS